MEQLEIYNALRGVPAEAKKTIAAGRLKGFTDINPMWRIKRLTEVFGPCGIGWWYVIKDKRLEGEGNEIRAFVDIDFYYVWDGKTSQPVSGTGGSSFVTQERNGAYTSDECYKMALTDALSVAAKSLGLGADVYYEKDRDKYTVSEEAPQKQKAEKPKPEPKPEPPKEQSEEEINAMFYPTADSMIQNQGGVEYAICSKCGGYIYQVRKKDGSVISVRDMIVLGLRGFNQALCKNCYSEAVKAARAK